MIASLFIAFFSLFSPNLRDYSAVAALYVDFYGKVDREIRRDADDPDMVKAEFRNLEKRAKQYGKMMQEIDRTFWEIDGDYNATTEQYYNIIEERSDLVDSLVDLTLDARDILGENLDSTQWNGAFEKLHRTIRRTIEDKEKMSR